tara:strand:+ start:1024 stop:1272 length:249 start_codon:yes stop_codon:yes gene_type:complete
MRVIAFVNVAVRVRLICGVLVVFMTVMVGVVMVAVVIVVGVVIVIVMRIVPGMVVVIVVFLITVACMALGHFAKPRSLPHGQ